jgi:hypothetical protein
MSDAQTPFGTGTRRLGREPARAVPAGLLTLALLAVVAALSLSRQSPPAVVEAGAAPPAFSSGRAMEHLRAISREPRPLGTLYHDEVRDYIFAELRRAGLQPEIQRAVIAHPQRWNPFQVATIENVVARLGGSGGGGRALVLAAHYDSAPTSFGAGDDGSGVAALLETLRALKAGGPLARDIILLFTDGEEEGLLGARAFVAEHRWMKDAALVLNFEARGVGGPSIMFETSQGNGQLIEGLAAAAPSPVANSLSYEIYRLLPNDTDFSVFRRAGLTGLNFAFIEGVTHYHTSGDNIENLDERSLQHHGTYALALARHFGNSDLDNLKGGDAVYFDLLGMKLVNYPVAAAYALAALAALLYIALVVYGLRGRRLRLSGLALGFLAQTLCLLLAAGLVWLVTRLVLAASADGGRLLYSHIYGGWLYAAGFVALTLALASLLYRWFGRRVGVEHLTAGALLWFLILTVVTTLVTPGGSYLFTWPLLFGLVSFGWVVTGREPAGPKTGAALLPALCAVPGVLLLVPVIYQLHVALGFGAGDVGVVILSALLLSLVLPLARLASGERGWLLPPASAVVALGFIMAAVLSGGFDRKRPRASELFYVLNADTGKAAWASGDARTDEWTSRFLTNEARRGGLKEYVPWSYEGFIHHPAPAAGLSAPEVSVLSDGTSDGVRATRLRIVSPRRAASVSVFVEGQVISAEVGGKAVGADAPAAANGPAGRWNLLYWAPPAEGIELNLKTRQTGPLNVRVVDKSYGLESLPGFAPRPPHLIPSRFSGSDAVFISRSFSFAGPG